MFSHKQVEWSCQYKGFSQDQKDLLLPAVDIFSLKYALAQMQVIDVLYQHKIQTVNLLESFLMGDNIITARNQHPSLATCIQKLPKIH